MGMIRKARGARLALLALGWLFVAHRAMADTVLGGASGGTLVDLRTVVGVPDLAFTVTVKFPHEQERRFTCPPRVEMNRPESRAGVCWIQVGPGGASVGRDGVMWLVVGP